jgi:hypothetical protein
MPENPVTFYKSYTSAFAIEKSKLTRILTIIEERFQQANLGNRSKFNVVLKDGKQVELTSMDALFSMDNTVKNPVTRLKISTVGVAEEGASIARAVVNFGNDSGRCDKINISVLALTKNGQENFLPKWKSR